MLPSLQITSYVVETDDNKQPAPDTAKSDDSKELAPEKERKSLQAAGLETSIAYY